MTDITESLKALHRDLELSLRAELEQRLAARLGSLPETAVEFAELRADTLTCIRSLLTDEDSGKRLETLRLVLPYVLPR